jgi:hypothetical protein
VSRQASQSRRKKPWHHQGDYFPKRCAAAIVGESDAETLRKAWARFEERARRSLHMEPPPTKRLAEVSEIAESIISTLPPDDEDDRRDPIGDDYQLESDIETLQQLTSNSSSPRMTNQSWVTRSS